MGLNGDLIQSRFQDIHQSLARLERIRELSRETFLSDQDTRDLASYRLLVAIEAAIQICFHVCAQRLHRVPEAYAECFVILGNAGVLDTDLSKRLEQMARFRNLLVHMYWEVDYNRVYDILQEHMDDLHQFVRTVGELM